MADGNEGNGGEGAKGGDGKGPEGGDKQPVKKDPVPYERFESESARRHKAETRVKELEDKAKADSEAALKETGKYKELYEGIAPKVKLAEELEKSVGEYFAAESEGLSDEQKALIPDGATHVKLAWLKKAKAAGVFGKQQKQPDKTFNGKPKDGLPPEKWYLELEEGDPKVAELTSAQYLELKAHRKALAGAPVKVPGGF